MTGVAPLEGMVVVDLSTGIAGGYCTKTLADGGAEVIKLEAPSGDPLRRWAIGGQIAADHHGPLFDFLACSKRSVVIDPDRREELHHATELATAADVVVWTPGGPLAEVLTISRLREAAPGAVIAAITPYGLTGPWADGPSTDLVLQAWAGAVFPRGSTDRPPVQIGGRPAEWLAGIFASVGIVTVWDRSRRSGRGEILDVSQLEALVLTSQGGQMYAVTSQTTSVPGAPERPKRPLRSIMIPSIERATDGWVGFMVATVAMWESFCILVERPDWMGDESLYLYTGRARRRAELEAGISEWVGRHSVAEVIEKAELLRVPVAPVGNGATATGFDHFVERKFFVTNPGNGFWQPDVPYTLGGGAQRRPPAPAPSLGELAPAHARRVVARTPAPSRSEPVSALPLAGLRVADFTAFWAGPIVGHFLAMMGAEVIHVESAKRPDGIRGKTLLTAGDDRWWEWAPPFHGTNTNKLGVTIDLTQEDGLDLARRLIARCDVMVENYAPRVIEQWGLGYESVRQLRSDIIMLRMPAFGLSGPWRDRTGYAQNMEQASGMAWVTGFREGHPHVPNGMCDPLAGTHATLALLLALEHRRRAGEGMLVEAPMVGAALNISAEQVLEYQAFGHLMERDGNQGPTAVPQDVYRCHGHEDWVAIAIQTDAQWAALCDAVGTPPLPPTATAEERRGSLSAIDRWLAHWCGTRTSAEVVRTVWQLGVPVATVVAPADVTDLEQLHARGFFEEVVHPVVGRQVHVGYPVRFDAGPHRVHRSAAPTLGQHNQQVFGGLLGMTDEELERLEQHQVIGTELLGRHYAR